MFGFGPGSGWVWSIFRICIRICARGLDPGLVFRPKSAFDARYAKLSSVYAAAWVRHCATPGVSAELENEPDHLAFGSGFGISFRLSPAFRCTHLFSVHTVLGCLVLRLCVSPRFPNIITTVSVSALCFVLFFLTR
jgi:hypothetical protein